MRSGVRSPSAPPILLTSDNFINSSNSSLGHTQVTEKQRLGLRVSGIFPLQCSVNSQFIRIFFSRCLLLRPTQFCPGVFRSVFKLKSQTVPRPPSISRHPQSPFAHLRPSWLAACTAHPSLRLSSTIAISAHLTFPKPIRHPCRATKSLHGAVNLVEVCPAPFLAPAT